MKKKKIFISKEKWLRFLGVGAIVILMVGLLTVLIDSPGGFSEDDDFESETDEIVERVDPDPLCQHKYSKSIIEKPASCTVKGLKVSTCEKCGGTREDEIALLDHVFTKTLPYDKNSHVLCCVNCGMSGEYEEHILVESIIEPTCKTDGVKILECVCGYEYEEVIYSDGHTVSAYEQKKDDIRSHYGFCVVCGDVVSKAHAFGPFEVVKEATCADSGLSRSVCADCGYIRENVLPYAHGDFYYEHGGVGHVPICGLCGHIFAEEDHTVSSFEYYDEDYHKGICAVCGAELDEEHTISINDLNQEYCTVCNGVLG